MQGFKKKMDEYIEALTKQNNANRTAVYDLEDKLAQKEKELHELYSIQNQNRISDSKVQSFFNSEHTDESVMSKQEKQMHQHSLDTLSKFEYDLKSRLFF